ncbi:MAG: hypothetical protein QOJ79_3289 [Actinomycetota bacterium]|jgi:hypothetical protein|nr:hypothetical protein [Actinomycetota bacterium]
MTLRRVLAVSIVLSLAVGGSALAGPAKGRPHTRVVAIPYTQPCVVALVPVHQFTYRGCRDEPSFYVRLGEHFASIDIADDSGKPVGISFNLYAEIQPPAMLFCGHASRLRVDGVSYVANPALLVGSTDCPYPPTSGTITVTLSSR